jgi:hypothetical protein
MSGAAGHRVHPPAEPIIGACLPQAISAAAVAVRMADQRVPITLSLAMAAGRRRHCACLCRPTQGADAATCMPSLQRFLMPHQWRWRNI